MFQVESAKQVKYTLEEAMKHPDSAQKISDAVNGHLKEMGYSDQKIRTFLLQKQLKLEKLPDRMDVKLNGRHLFFAVVNEVKAGSHRIYTVDIQE